MNLAKYSLDNTKIIYFFLAVLLIGGIFSFGKLGKKEDAPFVIKSAVIMTRYPGAEPAEVERLITEPISREIQSMSGVYKTQYTTAVAEWCIYADCVGRFRRCIRYLLRSDGR